MAPQILPLSSMLSLQDEVHLKLAYRQLLLLSLHPLFTRISSSRQYIPHNWQLACLNQHLSYELPTSKYIFCFMDVWNWNPLCLQNLKRKQIQWVKQIFFVFKNLDLSAVQLFCTSTHKVVWGLSVCRKKGKIGQIWQCAIIRNLHFQNSVTIFDYYFFLIFRRWCLDCSLTKVNIIDISIS